MADNVQFQATQLATPASGTTVSTDEAASGHIQRVKLAYSADGVDTHVTADASGLLINTGAHLDDIVNSVATTDQAITTKSAVFGYTTSGGGSFEPVKVTPSGALTVEVSDGGGSITVDGTVSISGTVPVTDNGGSLTVDGTVGISGTVPVSDAGGSLTVDGTVAATQSGTWNVGITGNVALPAGASTEYSLGLLGSNLATVTNGSNLRVGGFVDARQTGAWNVGITGTVPVTGTFYQATQPVSIAAAVPVTDNNGSLTVDGTVAVTDGGGSLTVDGTVTVAMPAGATATLASVNDQATSTTLLSANAARVGFIVWNDSDVALYMKFGTTASTSSFTVKLGAGDAYEQCGPGIYTGRIDGIWASDSTGAARVTEW